MPYRSTTAPPDADYSRAWRRLRRIKLSVIPIVVVALAGRLGMILRLEPSWLPLLVWGIGTGAAVLAGFLIPLALFLFRCPRCGRRGITHSGWIKKCPHCGLPKGAERAPDDGWQP